ncbi:MAG: hypothetical protein M1816_002690 [Peltula sp. TS41687]|nr:MAG: hypothetical protein M1816_002690 [Peltula sp. TS41687]
MAPTVSRAMAIMRKAHSQSPTVLEEMSRLGLLSRTITDLPLLSPEVPLSPRTLGELSRRQDRAPNQNLAKGSGSIDPTTVNNKAMFVLFGFLGAGLVITGIWFFFWAKNGGFYFKKGDWEDYKSTVLRRKGKDGKTLSNATKSTELGGGSVHAEYDHDDVVHAHHHHDEDVRQYRHEKPARVGGLNRRPDGSYYGDHTNSTRSETTEPVKTGHRRGLFGQEKKTTKNKERVKNAPRVPSTAYSFVTGDDSTIDTSSYVDEPRARQHSHRQHRSARPEHQQHRRDSRSPRKSHRDQETYSEPTNYGDGSTEMGDVGTKSYPHYIPGLSKGTRTEASMTEESRSERKARGGYRRGGGGRRRDSLSDSDGEVTSRWTVDS